jgi:DNA-binding GntR family transcriptional regulator
METAKTLKQIPKAALLPEVVYQQLKTAILTGVFRPGQTLRQEDVAKQLGVSRGPLREALPKLEAEGMIISMPHRGCAVVSLAPSEIAEIFELRAMLESSLAKAAARQKDPESVHALRELCAEMRELTVSKAEADRLRWCELNYELHNMLLAVAGRRHHLRFLEMVRALAEPYIRMEISLTGSLMDAQLEHEMLIEAFSNGDCERLEKLTRDHVQHTAQRLMEALKSAPESAEPAMADTRQ